MVKIDFEAFAFNKGCESFEMLAFLPPQVVEDVDLCGCLKRLELK